MLNSYSNKEKMALIAICKFIASSDGMVTSSEIDMFNTLAEEKGFEDFTAIFNEVDKTVQSEDDLLDLIKGIDNTENRIEILKYAIEMSRMDARIKLDEIVILNSIAEAWDIDINSLMTEKDFNGE